MNRFTLRSALVLAVVLLLAGATTSFAQVIFGASAGNPQVRVGGMTETVGDAALTSSNGTVAGISFPAGSGSATITLTYSSTITNKTLTGAAVTCTMGGANTPKNCPAMAMGPSGTAVAGILVTVSNVTINDLGAASSLTTSWTAAGNTLTIQFAPSVATVVIYFNSVGAAGGGLAGSIAIHGVRVNAAGLGIPPTLPTVSAFLNTNPSANIQLAAGSTSLTVGTLTNALGSVTKLSGSTNPSDKFYTTSDKWACPGLVAYAVATAACSSYNKAIDILPKASYTNCGVQAIPQGAAAGGSVIITTDEPTIDRDGKANFGGDGSKNAIGIKIVEGYPGALTSKTDEGAKSNTLEVDNGTRVRIDFTGLPSQVVVGAPRHVSTTYSPIGLTGMAANTGLIMDLTGSGCAVGVCAEKPDSAIAEIKAASGGAVTLEYEVVANSAYGASPAGITPALTASPGVSSTIIVPIFLYRTATPIDLGTINIAVTLGPRLGSTVVRFSDQLSGGTATVAVSSCATDLFYPWVTNVGTFDTGIAVINGGQDNSTNKAQSGPCVAYFFNGSTTGKTEVKKSTTPILGPGQTFAFTVSDATLGQPGFTGYVHVNCPFEGAHGFAMLTWGYGVTPTGQAPPFSVYLALVGKPSSSGISNR